MNLKCASCGSLMKERSGKFGEFYFCPKSTKKKSHGTISKQKVEEFVAQNLENVAYISQGQEKALADALASVDVNLDHKSANEFFMAHAMQEDVEADVFWADIIPRG